jgi:SAM-dependent methyltransferase
MPLPRSDKNAVIERYSQRFAEHGYSPKTLGWDKGKQDIRFAVLTSQYDFRGKSVLDIGCGFGDLNRTLQKSCGTEYRYHGVDLVPVLIEHARTLYRESHIRFSCADILSDDIGGDYDYAIASGIFNFKLRDVANYDFIQAVIIKALSLCRDGLAFDFLSDKVDYQHEHTFHSSPERILALAYQQSRNVVLRNDYMPFEFSLHINKDGSFDREDTVFHHYKQRQQRLVS